jgi:gliding motility-associated-like protein
MKYKNPLVLRIPIAISLLIFVSTLTSFSQNLAQSNWYFGNSVNGIRFNRSTNTPSLVNNQALPFGIGGSAVATDPSTANLLFYSDGSVIYDGCHLRMLNGSGLGGNNSGNQPVAICPVPGQPNKYFVFTNSANFLTGGTISRSVVDMNLFGNAVFPSPAFGDVENPKNAAIPGLAGRSEGMMIVPHANGTDYWLITHQSNSISYSSTLINAAAYAGTFNTTVSSTGNLPLSIANFSYHAGLKKMAVAPQSPNEDAIIFDFNDTNGIFTFDRFIFNTGFPSTLNQEIYDIEWSLSGQYLYISRVGETGVNADVLQYDYLNSNTSTPLTLITSVLGTPVFRSYGLQMAADSSIYYLYQAASGGPFLVDKFLKTDTIASSVVRVSLPFGNVDFGGQQFPSFVPKNNIPLTVSFTTIGSCQNTPTSFFPTVAPAADSLVWDFGDASTLTAWSPIHTYATAQTFNVTLTAFYQGQSQTATQPVIIGAFALQLNLVQDTTACRSEFPPPRGSSSPTQFSVTVKVQGGSPTSYVWSNGDIGATLRPDSAGYYYVVVSDASGCSAYAGVNVKEYDLQDGRGNIWYFGANAGINFNPLFQNPAGPAVALNNSAMVAPEGCAIICDRNGQVIFYTDGDKVYDKTDTQIDIGIGGDPTASQSSLIVPVQGDETLYYIFTTQAINGTSANELRYSLFDLKQNSGNGAVVQKNILLFGKSTERITANGTWLIAHEYGNNTFRSYPISAQGIGAPVYSSIGSDHSFKVQQNGEGYMKIGPRNNLAVALSTPGTQNLVELFHLNDTTGKLNNYRKIDLKEPNGQVYGIEFSPGGNKVFASVKGTPSPSQIFEYFIDSLEHPYFRQKISQPFELGEMQLGPDGQIYVAINGSSVLGTITASDDTTQVSSYNASGFALAAGTTSRLGLPNFTQIISNAFGGPSIEVTGLCFGQPTQFVGNATDAIDKFQWFFGDGGSDTAPTPIHTYAAPGTYNVSLRITNRCSLDTTLVQKVTIFAPPPNPTIPGAIALCTGVVNLNANTANLPGFTYNWSSGDTTKIVTVTEQSIIAVIITDTNGCQSIGQSIVVDNRPQLDLGPDVSICEDNSTPALNAQNPGANYQWSINGVNSSNSQAQAVTVTTPGVFTYKVIVTDPVTTCTVTDDKTYTIKVSPLFTVTGTNPTGCGLSNGTIQLNLLTSAPAGGPYSFFVSGLGGFNDQQIDQTAPRTINYANPTFQIAAGTYSGIVTDQISGCTLSTSIGLSDATYTPTAVVAAPNCDPVIVNITSNAPPLGLPLSYTVTNGGTGAIIGPTVSATAVFSTPGLAAGNYVIQLTDNAGCISTINQAITPNPPVAITVTPDACATPATITGSGATAYTWTGPGLPVAGVTGSILSIPAGQTGLLTYRVTATAAPQCPTTQTVDITVDPAATPVFVQSDACQTAVILTASPTGNYTYRWFRSGVFQPNLLGSQVSVGLPENGGSFSVTLVNTLNGCTFSSPAKVVNVVGPIDANLASTPACLDNQPFTLTATTTATGVSYAWSLNGTVLSPAVTTANTNQSQEGTYKVDISKSVCTTSAQLQITRAPIPAGELPNRVIICDDPDNNDPTTSKVDLDPGAFQSYDWLKNELTLSYTNRVITADSKGIYKVLLTNSFGCIAPDETEVLNQCIPKINAPNAFRPTSGQTANKDFYVFTFFITDDFQVFIYNRWGELVFESKDRDFKWNGGYRNNPGQPLPGGAYAYVIKYVSAFQPDKGVQEKHGGVALIR